MRQKTLRSKPNDHGEYLELVLDKDQVFPEDPGNGTPAMVYLKDDRGRTINSGTWFAASDMGELTCGPAPEETKLCQDHCDWLNNQADEVNGFLYESVD